MLFSIDKLKYSFISILPSLTFISLGFFGFTSSVNAKSDEVWDNWGQNINNTHNNPASGINKGNVKKIYELCKINYTQNSVTNSAGSQSTSSKPIIVKDTVYWTSFSGKIGAHKILRDNDGSVIGCTSLWVKDVSDLIGLQENGGPVLSTEPSSRSSPAYYTRANGQGALLYTAIDNPFSLPFSLWFATPPVAFAVDAETGNKLWQVNLVEYADVVPMGDAVMPSTTASPRIYNNVAYIGLASLNNALDIPLTFRGHMIALDLGENGGVPHKKWTQYTLPPRPDGYLPGTWFAGGGVWASGPSIIPELGLVIFGSGQLYNYPEFAKECMERAEPVITDTFTTDKKGQTGKGANECLIEAENKLKNEMGINQPLAPNSIIALNMADGTFAWHVPTAGLDRWRIDCGLGSENDCDGFAGPDWDVSGSAPMVVDLKKQGKVVISHNKGGSIYWIKADTGQLIRKADVCVGSSLGGIHWGLSYDPKTETILASCSGGAIAPTFGPEISFLSILANGRKVCKTGYLNAIDANTGALKWQTLPAAAEVMDADNSAACQLFNVDEQYKYGLNFDVVLKNKQFNVPVNVMPDSALIPLANQHKGRSNGVPANSNGIVYWPVYYGVLYALDIQTGAYLNEMSCDQGSLYSAGPSVAEGIVSFGCGYGFAGGANDIGKSIMIYGIPKYQNKHE